MSVWQERRIDSAGNETFKGLMKLLGSNAKMREAGLAVAEGLHLLQSLVKEPTRYEVDSIFLPEALLHQPEWLSLEAQWAGLLAQQPRQQKPLKLVLPMGLYKKLSKLEAPTGPLVVFKLPQSNQALDLSRDVVLLDDVQDPGNVGTLLRNCAAAGIAQVVYSPASAWVWGDKSLRAGMGAQFALNFFPESDLQQQLNAHPEVIVRVTSLATQSTNLFQTDVSLPGIWVFGSEGQGVGADWLARASQHLRIPQTPWVDSLNVASSSAICLFEQVRQRALLDQDRS